MSFMRGALRLPAQLTLWRRNLPTIQNARHAAAILRHAFDRLLKTEYQALACQCQNALAILLDYAKQAPRYASDTAATADVEAAAQSGSDFTIRPVRLQYVKGQRMRSPNGLACVYVGRPTPFANPYKVGRGNIFTGGDAAEAFHKYVLARPLFKAEVRAKLRGKNLACWCQCDGTPCHADVLMEIANA